MKLSHLAAIGLGVAAVQLSLAACSLEFTHAEGGAPGATSAGGAAADPGGAAGGSAGTHAIARAMEGIGRHLVRPREASAGPLESVLAPCSLSHPQHADAPGGWHNVFAVAKFDVETIDELAHVGALGVLGASSPTQAPGVSHVTAAVQVVAGTLEVLVLCGSGPEGEPSLNFESVLFVRGAIP